jgi:hypothetical protein
MLPFFGHFFGDGDNISDRQFLGDLLSYCKKFILPLPCLQVSYGVLGNFFPQIGDEVKKPEVQ